MQTCLLKKYVIFGSSSVSNFAIRFVENYIIVILIDSRLVVISISWRCNFQQIKRKNSTVFESARYFISHYSMNLQVTIRSGHVSFLHDLKSRCKFLQDKKLIMKNIFLEEITYNKKSIKYTPY